MKAVRARKGIFRAGQPLTGSATATAQRAASSRVAVDETQQRSR
jgi:hypothetical protein